MQTKIGYYVYKIRRSTSSFRRVCTLHIIIHFLAKTVDKINGKICNLLSENPFHGSHIYLFIPRTDIRDTDIHIATGAVRFSSCDSNDNDDAQHLSHGTSFTRFPLMRLLNFCVIISVICCSEIAGKVT